MKKIVIAGLFAAFLLAPACREGGKTASESSKKESGFVTELTGDSFKKLVFDYEQSQEFKFAGTKPVIIDFYADWCAPCRQISPIVESIAQEYSGKVVVYKVDTEKEKKLATDLGITGLPTILFIPVEGQPRSSLGAISREEMVKAINEILLVN